MNTTSTKKPRGRPPAFDHDEALEKALQLFWQHGYEGTSMAELMQAMGMNKPSIYAAFGNKEMLFRKALQRYLMGPVVYVAEALKVPTARQVVEKLLTESVALLTSQQTPKGCLLVQAALSCGQDSALIQQELTAQRRRFEDALRQRFARAHDEGDLAADANPAALARFVATLHQGISVQAAGGASREELMAVVELALRNWPTAR
ncbi:MAG TPA: TetR/AcrR family transcriptional regulator [Methylophilaceae bacterium]|nr:TetR/AcrR family transcriptional regulator [Methylophilaceae bacterium]